MGNIFEIQNDLQEILNTLEENGGELTPELEEALVIKQDELKDKVMGYTQVIHQYESEINCIKEEKNRLSALQKSKENTVEKLKNILTIAVNKFGSPTKSGTKCIDFGTGKVSTRTTESIEINDDLTTRFSNRVLQYYQYLKFTNQLNVEEVTVKDLLDYCNTLTSSEELDGYIKEEIPDFTEEDLSNLEFKANIDVNILELIKTETGRNFIKAFVQFSSTGELTANPDKALIKKIVKEEHKLPIYATLKQKQSVLIK